MKKLTGINKYLSVGVDASWIESYVSDNSFEPGNRKTDVMFGCMPRLTQDCEQKYEDKFRQMTILKLGENYIVLQFFCHD